MNKYSQNCDTLPALTVIDALEDILSELDRRNLNLPALKIVEALDFLHALPALEPVGEG